MEEWKKGSYHFQDFTEKEHELAIMKKVSEAATEIEKKIWSSLDVGTSPKILDLGCGAGFVSTELARFYPSGIVMGVDASAELIRYAKKEAERENLGNLCFRTGDVYRLGLEQESFDLIYSRFVFQHLNDPGRALISAVQVLKPGGTLCIVDIDDEYTEFSPHPDLYAAFNRRIAAVQAEAGGDRYIGRKLAEYLQAAGLNRILKTVIQITSDDLGLRNFLDLTVNSKLPAVPEPELAEVMELAKDIYAAGEHPEAEGSIAVFAVSGRKPV